MIKKMTVPKSIHRCKQSNEQRGLYYIYKDSIMDYWKLYDYDTHHVEYLSVTIQYCPFCGLDLSKEPDWNFPNSHLAKREYENVNGMMNGLAVVQKKRTKKKVNKSK